MEVMEGIEVIEVYKIFILEDNNVLKNLFHGLEGSRIIKFDTWLKADKKMSVDGSGQKPYLTGIHVIKEKEEAIKYLDNFRSKKARVVLRCYAAGLRQKPSNKKVYLADYIFVPFKNIKEKIA